MTLIFTCYCVKKDDLCSQWAIVKWRHGTPEPNYKKKCTLHFLQLFTAAEARDRIMKNRNSPPEWCMTWETQFSRHKPSFNCSSMWVRPPWKQTVWLCHTWRQLQSRLTSLHNFIYARFWARIIQQGHSPSSHSQEPWDHWLPLNC